MYFTKNYRLEFGNGDGIEGEEALDSPGSSDTHQRDELPLQVTYDFI